jgi:pimeloyl-ACP methyl ester carboxylesterase
MAISESLGQKKEAQLPQGTIEYRERGTGEPIVFVHGALVNADLWRKVVPELAKDYRCIAPDLPLGSHRRALPPDADLSPPAAAKLIADFIAALDLENVTLVGNDTGGALCQLVPERHRKPHVDGLDQRATQAEVDGVRGVPDICGQDARHVVAARYAGITGCHTYSLYLTYIQYECQEPQGRAVRGYAQCPDRGGAQPLQ